MHRKESQNTGVTLHWMYFDWQDCGLQATLAFTDRKPMPPPPLNEPPVHADATLAEVEAYNEEVALIYETLMAICAECGRKFKDESKLAKHSVGCKAGHFKPRSTNHTPISERKRTAFTPKSGHRLQRTKEPANHPGRSAVHRWSAPQVISFNSIHNSTFLLSIIIIKLQDFRVYLINLWIRIYLLLIINISGLY